MTSSGETSLLLNQTDYRTIKYDCINYTSDGIISSFYKNASSTISTNNNKKKIRIKDEDYKYYIPYERKDDLKIVESQEELIYDGVLKSNTTYELTSSGETSLLLNQTDYRTIKYDCINYTSDGIISSFYKNASSTISTNNNKKKIRIKDEGLQILHTI